MVCFILMMIWKVLSKACHNAKVECHFVDTRNITMPTGGDGIHPTDDVSLCRIMVATGKLTDDARPMVLCTIHVRKHAEWHL